MAARVDCIVTPADCQLQASREAEQNGSISPDLRQAIDLLRAVPSGRALRHQSRCKRGSGASNDLDASRQPLRPVNHHSNRLSLPAQLPVRGEAMTEQLAVRQCSSLTDDVVGAHNTPPELVQVPDASRHSAAASRYVLPWKIRRVKKQKLEQVLLDTTASVMPRNGHQPHTSLLPAATSSRPSTVDVKPAELISANCLPISYNNEQENNERSESNESLDTVVERILENAAMETAQRHKISKRRRREAAVKTGSISSSSGGVGTDRLQQDKQHVDKKIPLNDRQHSQNALSHRHSAPPARHRHKHQSSCASANSKCKQKEQPKTEKTLEDLFEEAVESFRDELEYSDEPSVVTQRPRLRSTENWERQVYDSDVHQQCQHYHLQTFADADVTHVTRGFAVVGLQRTDKKRTPDLEASRRDAAAVNPGSQVPNDPESVAYVGRTVISAKSAAASNDNRRTSPSEQHVDLCLEGELAANQRRRTSRSSSTTWDSVSVDSLVLYEDDNTSLQAAAAALYVTSAAAAERRQLNEEFVNKLRSLQEKWQQSVDKTAADADDDNDQDDEVWVPMTCHDDQQAITHDPSATNAQTEHIDATTCVGEKPEVDELISLDVVDNDVILSDCVTSQQIVINIKLPRRSKLLPRRPSSSPSRQLVPPVPFRDIRLRREIRYIDDVAQTNSPSALNDVTNIPAMQEGDEVTVNGKPAVPDVDITTEEKGVVLTAGALLTDDNVSAMCVGAEVEYQNTDSSHAVELVPVCDSSGRQVSQRVDVSRHEATRVVRLPSTSSRLIYSTPSLLETVDSIRKSLLTDTSAAGQAAGVSVSCEAEETVSHRADSDNSPPVVSNIVVDCLSPTRDEPGQHSDATALPTQTVAEAAS